MNEVIGDPLPEAMLDVVERFDHVSMAVDDFASTVPVITLIGGRHHDGGYEPKADFHWVQYDLPGGGRLELIRTDSTDPDHFIRRFIERRGEGLHHLTFKVRDLAEAVRRAGELGFTVVGYDDDDPRWKEAFIHPSSAAGVLIQFAEFPEATT
jgi:methylmalonyl-CoA/ethylmalonyl-CoA epimerase